MDGRPLSSIPVKTLWFEFLLTPEILAKHLNEDYADPSPIELIIQFLNNATLTKQTILPVEEQSNGVYQLPQSDQPPPPIINLEEKQQENPDFENNKATALKLLALKVAAHLKWDIEYLEKKLPLTLQFILLNELIKCCDRGDSKQCSLFAYITYYRWILRSIMRVSYPVRGLKGIVPIPLLQQIDPCYVPHDAMEGLVKKLHELSNTAVSDLERVVNDVSHHEIKISRPLFQCFKPLKEDAKFQEIYFDWSQAEILHFSDVSDVLTYELGRWWFFNENYAKAKDYFDKISIQNRRKYHLAEEYLDAANEMLNLSKREDTDIIDPEKQFSEYVSKIMEGQSCDLSMIEGGIDVSFVAKNLKTAFGKTSNHLHLIRLRKLCYYLCSKLNGLKELVSDVFSSDSESMCERQDSASSSQVTIEEGEIEMEEESSKPIIKDPELLLLDATDPESIQNYVSKIKKHPLTINKRWEIPIVYMNCLQKLSQVQYQKCHIILAKGSELRKAKLYMESRILYLSLLEDSQASLPMLANLLKWELLETDLEHHFETNDIDERRILDLLTKCERALRAEIEINDLSPVLLELCGAFLLEARPALLKDFLIAPNPVIRFYSLLASIFMGDSSKSKDFWDLLITAFTRQVFHSKRAHLANTGITPETIIFLIKKLKNHLYLSIIGSSLVKLFNAVNDNPNIEITMLSNFPIQWPSTGINSALINDNNLSQVLHILLNKTLSLKPNELCWIKCKAELTLIEGAYSIALKYYLIFMVIVTEYFTVFHCDEDEDLAIQRMILCSTKLGCYTQAAVLHQMSPKPNYALAFKALSERNCNDSCDDLYLCMWDTTILEFLVNLHTKRGEIDRKLKVVHLIGQLELNANNNTEIIKEAANVRRGKFFRMMAKKYL